MPFSNQSKGHLGPFWVPGVYRYTAHTNVSIEFISDIKLQIYMFVELDHVVGSKYAPNWQYLYT